jgi:hypothetical protein
VNLNIVMITQKEINSSLGLSLYFPYTQFDYPTSHEVKVFSSNTLKYLFAVVKRDMKGFSISLPNLHSLCGSQVCSKEKEIGLIVSGINNADLNSRDPMLIKLESTQGISTTSVIPLPQVYNPKLPYGSNLDCGNGTYNSGPECLACHITC